MTGVQTCALPISLVLVYSFVKSDYKKTYLISIIIFLLCVLVAFIVTYFTAHSLYERFDVLGFSANGRNYWYSLAISMFKDNLAFGIGFFGDPNLSFGTDKWCFHSTPLQLRACGGIIGTILILPFFVQKYYLFYKNRSESNMFFLAMVIFFALHGLIDITAFSFDKVLMILIICAFAESAGRTGGPVWKKEYILDEKEPSFYKKYGKRILDFSIASIALLVFSPLLAIIAIISRVKIGKPVIFVQPRPGKDCKVFKFYKFRSMKNSIDKKGNPLPDEQRITKWGSFLRKSSLDELPQLWNIIKGDMSIVGPRPRMVKDVIFYSKDVKNIYSVRPGMTGLDQVTGRNINSWERIFELDKQYAEKCSFWLDVKIFFMTFIVLFRNRGSAVGSATSKREYWYSDYLLKNKKIEKKEYDKGIDLARKIEQITLTGQSVDMKTYDDKIDVQ